MERKERSLVHCLKGQPTLSAPLGAPSPWDLLALGSCDERNLWKNILHREREMDWDYEPSETWQLTSLGCPGGAL